MKNKITLSIVIIVLNTFLFSCEKSTITRSWNGIIATSNCYILKNISAKIQNENNVDTIYYSDLKINLYFSGNLISQGDNEISTVGVVDSFFVNILKTITLNSNKDYGINNNVTEYFSINYQGNKLNELNGKELGFSPRILYLETAPSNSNYYSFTIEITDIYDNHFVATTDSIYITK